MIFTQPFDMPSLLNNDQLDAINIFAYLCSHTREQVLNGEGCNLNEFCVLIEVIELALFLNFEHEAGVNDDDLREKLALTHVALTDALEQEEGVTCEILLIYLLLARYEATFIDTGIFGLDEYKKLKLVMSEADAQSC
ncbi:hypothetical protein [Pedobacter sp.]|uniref:hypothetical protein n=1 Tax=Pedobacter sp. TaxID=1411316 RepID=UPI003D7F2013